MDKPISTPINLSTNMKSVHQLSEDYFDLLDLYIKQKRKYPNLVFELLTQRRYHSAFLKIKELVDDVAIRTGVPITSFQTTHCDGQWRMPSEIIEQNYHPYNQGYGKCSHSGYHSIDIMDWLVRSSIKNRNQNIDKIEVLSDFMYPNDFENHILKNYSRGHQEDARRTAIITFLKAINDNSIQRLSDIGDQVESIGILSSIYKSAYLRKKGKNPLLKLKRRGNE